MSDKLPERIPGSRYYRAYCKGCNEPIRVAVPPTPADPDRVCDDCAGLDQHNAAELTQRQRDVIQDI